jgi:hypothetical protein
LHVNVNPKAAVCEAFLKGYCPDGENCKLKHVLRKKTKTKQEPKQAEPATATKPSTKTTESEPLQLRPRFSEDTPSDQSEEDNDDEGEEDNHEASDDSEEEDDDSVIVEDITV